MGKSRVKTTDKHRIVFERVEEFAITGLDDAEAHLYRIKTAIKEIDTNIERMKEHRKMLEFECVEIEKYADSVKRSKM